MNTFRVLKASDIKNADFNKIYNTGKSYLTGDEELIYGVKQEKGDVIVLVGNWNSICKVRYPNNNDDKLIIIDIPSSLCFYIPKLDKDINELDYIKNKLLEYYQVKKISSIDEYKEELFSNRPLEQRMIKSYKKDFLKQFKVVKVDNYQDYDRIVKLRFLSDDIDILAFCGDISKIDLDNIVNVLRTKNLTTGVRIDHDVIW